MRKSWIKKIILIFLALITILVISGMLYQFIATKIDEYKYPAPGKMVDVGGYKLHIYCTGQGGPNIILDAGMGSSSIDWTLVQKEVSQFAHVCSYDRAGLGWSEKSPNPRTSKEMVHELHALLQASQMRPPYILVGHSFGGMNMRLYASTFPDEVFGVVLVDSAYEKQFEWQEALMKENPHFMQEPTLLERIKIYILENEIADYLGITRLRFVVNWRKEKGLSDRLKETIIAKSTSTQALKSMRSPTGEGSFLKESSMQVEQSHNALENKPLIVITRAKKYDAMPEEFKKADEAFKKIWLTSQQALVGLSKLGKHIFAQKSGHMINFEQPEIIVQAIREMVNEFNGTLIQVK